MTASHELTAVAHLAGGDYTLNVKAANVTLDNAWAPYGQVTLTCVRPPEAILEQLDPRTDDIRVTLTLTRQSGPYVGDEGAGLAHLWEHTQTREFDLLVVGRTASTRGRTITVRCDTDEAVMMGDGYLTATPDAAPFAMQESLRDIVNYVLDRYGVELYPGGPFDPANAEGDADASLFYYADETNLITNPSGEVNTTGWAATGCTISAISSAFAVAGSQVLRLSAPSSATSFAQVSAIPVTPGRTYALSGYGYVNGTASGTASSSARRIVVVRAGTGTVEVSTPALPASGMVGPEQVTATWVCPAGVTSVDVRIYLGTTVGDVRWDALKFCEMTDVLDPFEPFDGSTPDTDVYTYIWNGTVHASTSSRVVVDGASADIDAFTWNPGVTAWEFLEPLVQASGLRLYCDEARRWRLVNPPSMPVGSVSLEGATNLTDADEQVSRYSEWYDSVVVKYSWTTATGIQRVKYDIASDAVGVSRAVLKLEENRPYPGPGYAASVLARANGRGRVFDLEALSDYDTTPWAILSATIPDTPEQLGRVSAVTWDFPARTMRIRSTELVDISEAAWLEQAAGAWTTGPVGESWLEATV